MTKFSTCVVIAAVLTVPPATAEAKAYKGAEVYSIATVLYGRMEMRMRMIRGSGLISTFFTYKNGSEVAGTAWEETDVEALGKNDGTSWQSNLKTGNPPVTSEQLYTTTTSLADAYHTYAVEWTPDYVAWSFDGAMVRKTDGGQASSLTNGETLRFNAWASDATGWAGTLDASALPAYQFVNWIKYYRYDNGQFVLDWTDDFDSFDKTRWSAGNWTFDGNLVDFDPANAVVQDGTLILAITKEGETGFTGTVPPDDGTTDPGDGGVVISNPHSDSGCAIGGARANGAGLCAMLLASGFAVYRRRRRTVILAALVVGVLAPSTASATQGAELLKSQAYFYGRFEARIRFAPGEGVVSSFFLWKDGSDTAASWNELDFEKINSDCRLQTNVWSGKGNQSATINTPSFNICNDYHTYAFEWTPDYISWLIDGTQNRRVTGAVVTEYAQNATQGMTFHFNLWAGNSTFGGNLSASTLPVNEYISWVQYSSYSNSAFQVQWREDFNASGTMPPTGWSEGTWASPFNLSTHNPANVNFTNGIAVLSMTADNATGLSGPPPADPAGGTGGTSGTGGTTGAAGRGGAGGSGGTTGSAGRGGTGGSSAPGAGGTSSGGRGGATGTGGAAGNGAGGIPAGTGGNTGAGGIAGTGAEGGTTGAAGDGAGGNAAGAAGTGISGASGTGGTSSVGSGGAMASGGSTGSA
ncbi:MAG TPA: family 16 glycosylhydrolase, partial [Actinomycetota bacterium]|nr:family 16 glycosylhydrolase [Actinomycetota bacterium]